MEKEHYASIDLSDKYINRNLNDDSFHDDHVNYSNHLKFFHKKESLLFRIFYGDEQKILDLNDTN